MRKQRDPPLASASREFVDLLRSSPPAGRLLRSRRVAFLDFAMAVVTSAEVAATEATADDTVQVTAAVVGAAYQPLRE